MPKKKSTDPKPTTKQVNQIPTPVPGPFNMVNTITLSTDMETIYLIDNGRAIPYSLNTIGGVLVGVIKGQIVVVSAIEQMPDKDQTDTVLAFAERSAGTPIPNVKAAKIPTERGQWTMTYVRKQQKLCIMGAVDIDVSLTENNRLELQGYLFDLTEGFINIQKVGSTILVESLPGDV